MFCDYMNWAMEAKLLVNYGEFFGGYGATAKFIVGQEAEVNTFFNFNILGGYEWANVNHYFYYKDVKCTMTGFIIKMIQQNREAFNSKYIDGKFRENDFYSSFYKSWLNPDSVRHVIETDKKVIFHAKLRREEDGKVYETRLGINNQLVTIYESSLKGKRKKLISKAYYGTGDLIDYVNYCDKLIRISKFRKEA